MNTRGAMDEINYLIWPLVYGVAGYTWGVRAGYPIGMAIVGATLGVATALPLARAAFYDVELVAVWMLPAALLVPVRWRPWYLTALCAAPWLRLLLRRLRGEPASG